jgi:hypothetical protein
MRYVELRRHTDYEGDRLTPQGAADAEMIGRDGLHPPYAAFVSTGAARATQMLEILRHAAGQDDPDHRGDGAAVLGGGSLARRSQGSGQANGGSARKPGAWLITESNVQPGWPAAGSPGTGDPLVPLGGSRWPS